MAVTIRSFVIAIAALLATGYVGRAQTQGVPERFTAMAVNMNRGGSGTVEIVVNRWSTDSERNRLVTTALEKGADKLLDTLQGMPKVGYIRTPDSIGWDLHYAHHSPLPEGGERVVIATDRPIGFWEAAHQPRSLDDPFSVIEMQLSADGEGRSSRGPTVLVERREHTDGGTLDLRADPLSFRSCGVHQHILAVRTTETDRSYRPGNLGVR